MDHEGVLLGNLHGNCDDYVDLVSDDAASGGSGWSGRGGGSGQLVDVQLVPGSHGIAAALWAWQSNM